MQATWTPHKSLARPRDPALVVSRPTEIQQKCIFHFQSIFV